MAIAWKCKKCGYVNSTVQLTCLNCGKDKDYSMLTEDTKSADLLRSDDTPGSATSLRELKTELIGYIRSFDLNDDQELCIDSQNLICGWIDLFFENKIYDEDIK